MRQVVVFRLQPLNKIPVEMPHAPFTRSSAPQVTVVPVEERNTERAFVAPNRKPYEMERREAGLAHQYREYLIRLGHDVQRLRLLPPGETAPLYCYLWDLTTRTLIEAKATVSRTPADRGRSAPGLRPLRRRPEARRAGAEPTPPRPACLPCQRQYQGRLPERQWLGRSLEQALGQRSRHLVCRALHRNALDSFLADHEQQVKVDSRTGAAT